MPIVKFGIAISDRSVDVDIFLAESSFLKTALARRREYMKHWATRLGVLENLVEALRKFDEGNP